MNVCVFKIKEYSVIFFVDNIIFDTKKVKHGNIVIIDKIPKKEGYKFIGCCLSVIASSKLSGINAALRNLVL